MSTRLRYLYRAYRYRWRVDPAEIKFVRRSLRPGDVAVDIGCHKGAYTYWMRRRVGPAGAVYAFEPQPKQVAYLREAFSAMRYDNVEIVPMALSDKAGQMPLYMPNESTHYATLETRGEERGARNENSSSGLYAACSTLTVDVTTLDEFFSDPARRPPNFLKIDVEGHELSVLQGGKRTLEMHRPTILVECETRHRPDGDVRPVFEFLTSLGYRGSFFSNGVRRPLAEFNPAVHQKTNPTTNDLPAGYVNNFAFERTASLSVFDNRLAVSE
jgi:FkbM family methyltransferase